MDPAKLQTDTDQAIFSHSGFGEVFNELKTAMAKEGGKPAATQKEELQMYLQTINTELTQYGFPKIDLNFDKNGQMHVMNAQGKELDPNTLNEKASVANPKNETNFDQTDVHNAAAAANKSGHWGDMFKGLESFMKGVPPEQQQEVLNKATEALNKELTAMGKPPVTLKAGADGHVHVFDQQSGKELDADTLKEKSAAKPGEPKPNPDGSPPKPGDHKPSPDGKHDAPAHPHKPEPSAADYWKQHERKDTKDGTDITVKQGDSVWGIAKHVAEERLGHKMDPKNPQDMAAVLKLTKEIAAANHIPITKDGHAMIKDGDHLHIPAAKDSSVRPPNPTDHPKNPGEKPEQPKPGEKPGEKPAEKPAHPPSHHGKVERNGNTTTITEDNGATETIKTDDKGNPVEVTRSGGHWGAKQHFTKTGDNEWTDDKGQKTHAEVKLGKDGTYSYKSLDTGVTKTYKPDGSSSEQAPDGHYTKIQGPDGPHQHKFVQGQDGKWASNTGEKYDDVKVAPDGTITAKGAGVTKEMRPDGSQVDKAADGHVTFVQSPDGKHQHSYAAGKDGKWTANPGGEKFDDVKVADDGTVTAKANGVTKVMRPDGSQTDKADDGHVTFVQTPDGKHQHSYVAGKDGKWTANPGGEKFDDVKVADDGTVTAKANGVTKVMRPDGSQIDKADDGHVTFVQTADGPRQTAYSKDAHTGKWTSQPASEKNLDDVNIDDKGVITAKATDGSRHVTYPNGGEVDFDKSNRMTHLHTPDGKDYNLYYMGQDATTPKFMIGGGHYLKLDDSGKFYTEKSNKARVNLTVKDGAMQIEDSNGKTVFDVNGEHH